MDTLSPKSIMMTLKPQPTDPLFLMPALRDDALRNLSVYTGKGG